MREVITQYEELLDKLAYQNKKLKDWIKARKRKERKARESADLGTTPRMSYGKHDVSDHKESA